MLVERFGEEDADATTRAPHLAGERGPAGEPDVDRERVVVRVLRDVLRGQRVGVGIARRVGWRQGRRVEVGPADAGHRRVIGGPLGAVEHRRDEFRLVGRQARAPLRAEVARGGDEGLTLRVALQEEVVERLHERDAAGVAPIRRGEEELAEPE